jgi:hypothetical protein
MGPPSYSAEVQLPPMAPFASIGQSLTSLFEVRPFFPFESTVLSAETAIVEKFDWRSRSMWS